MDVGQTTLENLSITLESLPNEGMKQMAVQMVMQSLNAGKSGQRGITTSDSIFILDLIEKGQIKLASLYLSIAEEREFEKQMEQQRAMQQENAQVQIQSAQAAEQAKVQAEQAKAQIEIQKHAAITNIDLQKEEQLQRLKGEQKLEQITLEATLEATLGVEVTGTV
jgi:regulator of protease activity HflC (stomatin/prohibitin superfamily)